MPQLGLGLGLDKSNYLKPLPKWLTDAGCTFAINVDRQVKALANPNSPLVNPLEDVGYPKKFNISQSVVNGDFANGTTGWSSLSRGTLSVSGGIITNDANNVSVNVPIETTTLLDLFVGQKIFVKVRVRVSEGAVLASQIALQYSGSLTGGILGTGGSGSQSAPVVGQWYELKSIITVPSGYSGKLKLGAWAFFPGGTNVTNYKLQVDGNIGVFAIPITNTPLENYTADKNNALITEYFEGTKEISAKSTALLQSFAGTTTDGYTQIALPNGKNPWMVNFDGTDSNMVGVNTADTNIIGAINFGLGFYVRTNGTLVNSWLISKAESSEATTQYGVKITSLGELQIFLNGTAITLATGLAINTPYKIVIVREAGVLKCEVNDVETYSAANVVSLTTRPNLRLGARSSNAGGTTHTEFYNGYYGAFDLSQGSLCTLASFKKSFAKLIGGTYV